MLNAVVLIGLLVVTARALPQRRAVRVRPGRL